MNIKAYIRIARPDHWVKNIFVTPGLLLAFFFSPVLPLGRTLCLTAVGFVCACWYAALAAVKHGTPPLPPASVLGACWVFGAFPMAAKRFAELRHIGDPTRAGDYRKSCRYYTEMRLMDGNNWLVLQNLAAMFCVLKHSRPLSRGEVPAWAP